MGPNIPEEAKESEDLKLFKDAVDKLEDPMAKEGNSEGEGDDLEERLAHIRATKEELEREGEDVASPMHLLRQKELELRGKLLEAEKEAEAIVAEAREQATKIRTDADQIAVADAKEYYNREIEKAKKEAEKRRSSVADEVREIGTVSNESVEKAMQIVLKAVTLTD
jgi:vacuolar-type H+-ATPase subunit H